MISLPFHSQWACGSFWLETSVNLTTGTMPVHLLGMTCTDPPSGIAGSQKGVYSVSAAKRSFRVGVPIIRLILMKKIIPYSDLI